MSYIFAKRLSDGVIGLTHDEYGKQLWTLVSIRKTTKCAICRDPIVKKAAAWSPITHGYNRMHRICATCCVQLES